MDLKQRAKAGVTTNTIIPLGSPAEGKKLPRRKPDKPTTPATTLFFAWIAVLSLMIGAGGTYVYLTKISPTKVEESVHHTDAVQPLSPALQDKLKSLENDKAELERKLQAATQFKNVDEMGKRLNRLVSYKEKSIEAIKRYSKQQLLSKYGRGPYYVDMQIEFDPDSNVAQEGNDRKDHLILQLADADHMPHTVYWFLEQVTNKMYDGCSFHRNAGHVIQAGPSPNFKTPPSARLMKPFLESGLNGVLFQEYSPEFPHAKYTVGYAGRPGGPDFYISTQDNTKIHGPGGQGNYADPTEADPCFAKLLEDFHRVADRIHRSSVKTGPYKAMEHNVAITSMRMVKYDPETKTILGEPNVFDSDEEAQEDAGIVHLPEEDEEEGDLNEEADEGEQED